MNARWRIRVAALLLPLLSMGGCPNMDKQSNFRPYEAAPQFSDRSVARPIPRHTVPRDAGSVPGGALAADIRAPAREDIPVPITRGLLERGRERYGIYCAVCHGADGYGDGIVVARGFPAPPSYHEQRLVDAPAGHFFDVITQGYGVMYSYADRVSPSDRWAIAAYIRALQRSQRASLADVPSEERARLEASP